MTVPDFPSDHTADPSTTPGRRAIRLPRHPMRIILAAGLLALVALAAFVVVRIQTDHGEMVLEIEDSAVEVVVRRGDATVVDRTTGRRFTLRAGDYQVELADQGGKVRLEPNPFTIRRGEAVLVRGKLESPKGPEAVLEALGDRVAAGWVLETGGRVDVILADGKEQGVAVLADLPRAPFKVRGVNLDGRGRVTDADLVRLRRLADLRRLSLRECRRLSDAGLRVVEELPALEELILASPGVGDGVVAHLKKRTGLKKLHLFETQISDAGLAGLRDLKALTLLQLQRTRLTDAGLPHLRSLKDLTVLFLNDTSVTDAGLAELAALDKLEQLHLTGTSITGTGLTRLKSLSRLSHLNLHKTQVTDTTLVSVVAALPGLTDLNLNGTAVGDAGMEYLVGMRRLRWLGLGESKVTRIGLARVKAALPGCEVVWIDPGPVPAAAPNPVAAPLEITADTTLDPKKTYGPLVVKTSGVRIDGRGAWVIGATAGDPKTYTRVGIVAKGVANVTLKNVNARGWETGLRIEDGDNWTVEGCNFSGNFHDPAFGWGENGRRGGIVLERVHRSTVRHCRANDVWDGCVLVGCSGNRLEGNDFSRASNTCLRLWNASRNAVCGNDLNHGIRISPGEVHARDSACVLIESGSNDNRFVGNSCTHGGDGIFIRVLNGWVSTGNWFEGNNCSHANNNCVEAWSPRNTYIRNKANHGSYGFWLGASDQTVLIGNEASYNGLPAGNHNSPHLPEAGHAGIVFLFGPSSHTVVRRNRCVGNHGAGIALVGDLDTRGRKWKAYHWIVEQNTLRDNRWGVYAQHADWLDLAANVFQGNTAKEVHLDDVTHVTRHPDNPGITRSPQARLAGPSNARVGQEVAFDAAGSSDPGGHPLRYRWDLGDGTVTDKAQVRHTFRAPGFYRVGLTVNNGLLSDLAWRDFYVVADVAEVGTEGQAREWTWNDDKPPGWSDSKVAFADDREVLIAGKSSVRALVKPYSGARVNLLYPSARKAGLALEGKGRLVFWIKAFNEDVTGWQGPNPVVTLHESAARFVRLTPRDDLLRQPPHNEAREGWLRIAVPLAGDALWQREGVELKTLNYLTIGLDSWGHPPLRIWLDGLGLE